MSEPTPPEAAHLNELAPASDPSADALLTLLDAVDLQAGAEKVAKLALNHGAHLLPGCALGLCVVDPSTGTRFTEIHLPEGSHAPPQDPTRLFPCFAHELVLALPELPGSTLHVASHAVTFATGSRAVELATRLCRLSATMLRQAHAFDLSPNSMQVVSGLKQRLAQTEKLASLGQVVTGVVHELATPLTAIISYASYLKDKAQRGAGDPADVERLTRIGESAERILEFTRDLVAYARPTRQVPAAVDLHQVIHKALVFCDHELTSHQVKVSLNLSSPQPQVLGAHGGLTQIFVNLVINAAQAMSKGGVLTISSEHDQAKNQLVVRLIDQGPGIASNVLPRIFEPFFTTKSDKNGTGLGLSIVQEIVQTHRGKVEVHSTVGRGTTFVLTFPSAAVVTG